MSKQDRQGVRTASELEQKHNFGKQFAEIMGVATGAQKKAEEVEKNLNNALTSEEIFNILTDNGQLHGIFRGEDGELYINAQYIVALEYLFAKDIEMSGKFTYTTKTYLAPEQPEIDTLKSHILGNITIPAELLALYDFNNDGVISTADALKAQGFMLGLDSFAEWSGAVETEISLTIDLKDPQKAFRITGTNMWGRTIDSYIGVQGTSIKHTGTANYIVEQGVSGNGWHYKKWSNGEFDLWANVTLTDTVNARNEYYYHKISTLPFSSTGEPFVSMTLKNGTSAEILRGSTPTYVYDDSTNQIELIVMNADMTITENTEVGVSVFIKGSER